MNPEHYLAFGFENYNVQIDENGIALIQIVHAMDSLEKLKSFTGFLSALQFDKGIKAILYIVPTVVSDQIYAALIQLSVENQQWTIVDEIYGNINSILKIDKPIISLLTQSCFDLSLASLFWARYRFALSSVDIGFEDSKYGLFAGFGINSIGAKIVEPALSLPFLLRNKKYSSSDMRLAHIFEAVADDFDVLVEKAKAFVLDEIDIKIEEQIFNLEQALLDDAYNYIQKRARSLPKGLSYGIDSIRFACVHTLENSLTQEKDLYIKLWSDTITIDYLRLQYFAVKEAILKAKNSKLPNYELKRLAVLGAGMMGAGIAFEAAKAAVTVVLKDSTLERAEWGKMYSLQVSDKLLQHGRMSVEQQEELLSHILPTADLSDFKDVDLIIEAVNEDKSLKALVTAESVSHLCNTGFFASNTTSIPITDLANAISDSSKFIGMHFFSPVDRMALLEIIKGEYTSEVTVQKALYVASKLGKIPIVVNDGPAFFTSRIFFNYLLEAITMIMEGISPIMIEEQAKLAGFGVSPLAVLDEISLPLMLQVYDQLPDMHHGQRRAYNFLTEMLSLGRLGRKSNAGFYTYSTEGKELWTNTLINNQKSIDPILIQKRLLHVVALDSYRCLETGILEQAIDADLGSVLGLSFPTLTGGVISYIDQVGIQQFVQDCQQFKSYGEQWTVSDQLVYLAKQNFRFYSGLESNWEKYTKR